MKWIVVVLILYLWLSYAAGHDSKPVSKIVHIAAHIGYAAFTVAVVMWL